MTGTSKNTRGLILKSPKETNDFAHMLGEKVQSGSLLCLYGDLGVGKTTFVRGFARGLGINSKIQSPTFTYLRTYEGRLPLYHLDCYRLSGSDVLLGEELQEFLLRNDGVTIIEWAGQIEHMLPKKRTTIHLTYINETTREMRITHENL